MYKHFPVQRVHSVIQYVHFIVQTKCTFHCTTCMCHCITGVFHCKIGPFHFHCTTCISLYTGMFHYTTGSVLFGKYAIIIIILYYVTYIVFSHSEYNRTPLIRPPSESHWCGHIRGMVAREGFVYEQKPLSVTRNVVV